MKLKSPKGGSALEFALVLPVLLLVVLGIVEFAILLFNQAIITNACREGARAGIVKGGPYGPTVPPLKIRDIVEQYCKKPDGTSRLITFSGATAPGVTSTAPCPGGAYSGTDLNVTVTFHHTYFALSTFVPGLAGGTDLTAVSVMRCE